MSERLRLSLSVNADMDVEQITVTVYGGRHDLEAIGVVPVGPFDTDYAHVQELAAQLADHMVAALDNGLQLQMPWPGFQQD